jgi:hypothetical protein
MTTDTQPAPRPLFVGDASLYRNGARVLRHPQAGVTTLHPDPMQWTPGGHGTVIVMQARTGTVCGAYLSAKSADAIVAKMALEGWTEITPIQSQP